MIARGGTVLVDSNVLLDVLTEDPVWYAWSSAALAAAADRSSLAINPFVYAEVSIGFERIEELDAALPPETFLRLPLPWPAAFLEGKCFSPTAAQAASAVRPCRTSTSVPTRRSKRCRS